MNAWKKRFFRKKPELSFSGADTGGGDNSLFFS